MRKNSFNSRAVLSCLTVALMTMSAGAADYIGNNSAGFSGPLDSFFDVFVSVDLLPLGPGIHNATGLGTVSSTLRIPVIGNGVVLHSPDSSDGTTDNAFNTEMLSMNLFGSGVMLRESPTLASTGRGTLTPDGYYIASFFDVFVEISVDGGQNWTPGNQPVHLSLTNVPEAGSTLVLLSISLGLLGFWRRSWRGHAPSL